MNIWEDIKQRINCIDIANESGIDTGKNKAVCPFCQSEKKPSFYVTEDYFVCHRCQEKGDIFTLYSKLFNTDRWGAYKELLKRSGIEYKLTEKDRQREDISAVLSTLANKYWQKLRPEDREYLHSRGLNDEFIDRKLIGYVPAGEPYSDENHLKTTGLPAILSERILIPFWQGSQIVYFTGRAVKDDQEPKYKNQKGDKQFIGTMRGPELIITEGIFDQLLAEQAGYNCIGIAGSTHDIQIHKGIKKVILIFDGDTQGRKYTEKYAVSLFEQGAEVLIISLPEGIDLADHIKEHGNIDDLESVSVLDFYMERLRQLPKNKDLKKMVYRILKVMDEIDRDEILGKLKNLWKASIQSVRKDFTNYTRTQLETEYQSKEGFTYKLPDGYSMSHSGIRLNGKTQITFEPYFVSRVGENKKTGIEYVETTFRNNGRTKSRIIERKSVAVVKDLLEESNHGAPVNSANAIHLIRFFDAWLATNRDLFSAFDVVSQLGWISDHQFVLTDKIVGTKSNGEQIYYIGDIDKTAFSSAGTLDGWTEAVKLLSGLKDGHVARFLVYAGFASAILEPLNLRPFIIHLHGDTSIGKTTALRIPASIYGNPNDGKAMVRWNNTYAYITRYMENLKNIPLIIDELSSENKKNFDSIIYTMESGLSKGKASKNDPNAFVKHRTYRLGVFSSGEPPILSDKSLGGAVIRVWEFHGSPFGEDNKELIRKLEVGLSENHGVAIGHFIENFLNMDEEIFRSDETFYSGSLNALTNVETRMLKILDTIYLTGLVVNTLFGLEFDVAGDMEKIFEILRMPVNEKIRTVDKLMDIIRDYYEENQFNFPEVGPNDNGDKMYEIKFAGGKIPNKIYGYVFEKGRDLGIIKTHFKNFINEHMDRSNAGDYAVNILLEKGILKEKRREKQVRNERKSLVYFENFFKDAGIEDEDDPFN